MVAAPHEKVKVECTQQQALSRLTQSVDRIASAQIKMHWFDA